MSPISYDYNFTILNSVDSTNNYAMQQAHAGLAEHGAAYFTYYQTAGKGQRTKKWNSLQEQNILMSLVIDTKGLSISQGFCVSAIIAIATQGFLAKYVENVKIKWPNDIYINDRKTGGILLENQINHESWKFCIAGMGININQQVFDENLTRATSLANETGKFYHVLEMAKELAKNIMMQFEQLKNIPAEQIIEIYNKLLFKKNEWIKVQYNNTILPCLVKEVNTQGQLICGEHNEWVYNPGEIEWQF